VNWWRWATLPAVTTWVPAVNWSQPRSYNWGENVYFQDDSVFFDGQAIATADEFAQQAQQIAFSIPEVQPDAVEWLPLGVFAICEDDGEETGPEPTLFLQLAISKEGIIAGSLQNTATDDAFEVEGMIDQESQRAAWGPVGEDWPIMETGIANLTEDDAPAIIHFDDGQTQQWLLIRLDEPKGEN
jgi:hypothetical protein